jgi:V8-like Glu-specific endopeptidase
MPIASSTFGPELSPDDSVSNGAIAEVTRTFAHDTDPGAPGRNTQMPDAAEDGTEHIDGDPRPPSPELRVYTSVPIDVATATYGSLANLELINGTDDRMRIADPSKPPWCMNASLRIFGPDHNVYLGTGWFISPRTLITAGHCVYIHDADLRFHDWVKAIQVMPGRNGDSFPFTPVTATSFFSVAGWTRDKNPDYDYGAIVLPSDLGDQTGVYGIGVFEEEWLKQKIANIAGYPGDKIGPEDGTQWYDRRPIMSVDEHQIYYDVDTWGGQSGSAVWVVDGKDRYAVGIHAYGEPPACNAATRITPAVMANMRAWKR